MNPIVCGNPSPISEPVQTTWRRLTGREAIQSWVGTEDAVRAMERAIINTGAFEVTVERDPGSALCRIRAFYTNMRDGRAEEIDETLTIRFADATFAIAVHPQFIDIEDTRIKQLQEWADDASKVITTQTSDPVEQAYMGFWRRGEQHYRAAMPVVIYTRNVAEDTGESLDVIDAGVIYTPAQVAGFLGAPAIFAIPPSNVGARSGYAGTIGYRFVPEIEYLSNGRLNLVETYEFGVWSELYL